MSEVTAIGGLTNKLYIVSKSDLSWMNPSENNPAWEKAGKAESISPIAGSNGKLYAVDSNGELLKTKAPGRVKWKNKNSGIPHY